MATKTSEKKDTTKKTEGDAAKSTRKSSKPKRPAYIRSVKPGRSPKRSEPLPLLTQDEYVSLNLARHFKRMTTPGATEDSARRELIKNHAVHCGRAYQAQKPILDVNIDAYQLDAEGEE